MKAIRICIIVTLLSGAVLGQGALTTANLLQPAPDTWPTYNGDYSGRRYSPLSKINASNIKSLSLAWVYRVNSTNNFSATIKATPLVVNGVMYVTLPDHVWAID